MRVDHIVFVVSNIKRTEIFYSKFLGKLQGKDKESVWYEVDSIKLFFVVPWGKLPPRDRFNANRIGLEHFAFGVGSLGELKKIETLLKKGKIKHSGIHIDTHSKKEKIWLNDPDGIRIEFYLR